MKKFFRVLGHIIAWLALLSLPTMFRAHGPLKSGLDVFEDIFTSPRLPNNILLVSTFYLSYYFVIPRFYFKKLYLLTAVYVMMCFGALFLINYNITISMEQEMVKQPHSD